MTATEDDGPTVKFDHGQVLKLSRRDFTVPGCKASSIKREQFPLRLAYALTVHRAQGQTIPALIVDCEGFFKAGQLGVALGRAVCKQGLQVLNYKSEIGHLKHPPEVYDFYERESQPPNPNLLCCKPESCELQPDHDSPLHATCKVTEHAESETQAAATTSMATASGYNMPKEDTMAMGM